MVNLSGMLWVLGKGKAKAEEGAVTHEKMPRASLVGLGYHLLPSGIAKGRQVLAQMTKGFRAPSPPC